jgi:hypothetical protein
MEKLKGIYRSLANSPLGQRNKFWPSAFLLLKVGPETPLKIGGR